MSLPIRHLPVLQNWDCHLCGQCCKEYLVTITAEEKKRIESQGWQDEPGYQGVSLFRRRGSPWKRTWQLNHRADGSCVFLSTDGRCKIHERFGYQAKPLPCRVFPFILIPAGDHWRVGIRYACPSAAANLGKGIEKHESSLREFADELVQREKIGIKDGHFDLPLPSITAWQTMPWADVLLFVKVLLKLMADRRDPVERRWRKCLALSALARQARYDKVTSGKLTEFLEILATGIDADVPRDLASMPPPSGIGRVLFRMILAIFTRKDQGPLRGTSARGRLALFRAAVGFVRGKGNVPRLHAWLPERTFAAVEATPTRKSDETEQILERYYTVKIGSLQFPGAPFFRYSLLAGLNALALTYPMIQFLARMFHELPPTEALTKAISIVDDHFGFNKVLGSARCRLSYHILGSRGETERLIAWYSR